MRCRNLAAAALVVLLPAMSGCVGLFATEVVGMAASGAVGDTTADLGHRNLTWAPAAVTLRRAYTRMSEGAARRWPSGVMVVAGGTAARPVVAAGLDLPAWTIRYRPDTVIDAANTAWAGPGDPESGRCTGPVEVRVTLSGLQWDLVSLQVNPGHIRRWRPVARVALNVVVRAEGKQLLREHYENRASGPVHEERPRLDAVPPVLDDALVGAYAKAIAGVGQSLGHAQEGACASG